MTTVTFKNGEKFTVKAIWGKSATFQGANRNVLEIRVDSDSDIFEQLKSIYLNPETLSEIYVEETNSEGEVTASSYHNNYTIGMELGLKTIEGASQWVMKLAQKTSLEIMQEQQGVEIARLRESLNQLNGNAL